jgi:hypothetical protein
MPAHFPWLRILVKGILLAAVASPVWAAWRRNGFRLWQKLLIGSTLAILAYAAFIALIDGPGAPFMDRLPFEASAVLIAALALMVLLGLCEMWFRALDGPFPKLAGPALNIDRRKLYPWMGACAAIVALLYTLAHIGPASWHDNLSIAAWVCGIQACIVFWFLNYKARRFDYGRTALQASPWFRWSYTAGELDAWKPVAPGVNRDTWIGPDGLLCTGDYAPWTLSVYRLVRAEAPADLPSRLVFTFKKTSFGDATSEEVMSIPIPVGHQADLEVIERKLRALCPAAEINLQRLAG